MKRPHNPPLPRQKLITHPRPHQRLLEEYLSQAIHALLRNRCPLAKRNRDIVALHLPRGHQLQQPRRIVLFRQLQLRRRQDAARRGDVEHRGGRRLGDCRRDGRGEAPFGGDLAVVGFAFAGGEFLPRGLGWCCHCGAKIRCVISGQGSRNGNEE
ncbi:hypothetical protein EJ04DRAFT_143511 [Polyplosphaeria fusca]|uniref:Uncharacterized protein n=1 Tax=Polyplosphaeria fusca TaxID=682080 RepID=A0A9P4R4M0_9PLEO|nr:hypothetical protein EJ04DRAFT_143511 [Polyplosphaeria fusca]